MAEDSGAFKTIPVHSPRVPPFVMVGSAVAAGPHRPKNTFFGAAAATRASDFINVCDSIAVFLIQPDSQL